MQAVNRGDHRYTAYFCEENAWWLAHDLVVGGTAADDLTILFFSNPGRQVLLMNQASAAEGALLCWDYHVVVRRRSGSVDEIMDFDTRLGFPVTTMHYVEATFPRQSLLPPPYRAMVRQVAAASYLERFQSDRSHMQERLQADRFPRYPPIQARAPAKAIDLGEYWDMRRTLIDGSRAVPLTAMFPGRG
ncbi:MAG: hypothetical protein KDI88_12530 [Gammaproteobacteria bacterium]|nr:hypothetical protein [Gammaproteobacteria bacterium]